MYNLRHNGPGLLPRAPSYPRYSRGLFKISGIAYTAWILEKLRLSINIWGPHGMIQRITVKSIEPLPIPSSAAYFSIFYIHSRTSRLLWTSRKASLDMHDPVKISAFDSRSFPVIISYRSPQIRNSKSDWIRKTQPCLVDLHRLHSACR